MNLYIISGGSRGLGASLINSLSTASNKVFSLSRSKSKGSFIKCDISKPDDIENAINGLFSRLDLKQYSSITLINNAGTIDPIGPVSDFDMSRVIQNISINFSAVVLLSQLLIKHIQELEIPKNIINISSGAALKPYAGWSLYCAAKAGVEHFGRCLSVEQEQHAHPINIWNINPGVMDTGMQKLIRETEKDKFPTVQRFLDFKKNGALKSPDDIAQLIIDAIHSGKLKTGGTFTTAELEAL